jgi:hypothetical protein
VVIHDQPHPDRPARQQQRDLIVDPLLYEHGRTARAAIGFAQQEHARTTP